MHPQITVVSSGETPDPGHPRASFLAAAGLASRSRTPLLFSIELAAMLTVDAGAASGEAADAPDPTNPAMLGQARRRFRKRLNGLIKVRTDGRRLLAARRAAAGNPFVASMVPAVG